MALDKLIANSRTGHANRYWRLAAISIDAHTANVMIVLCGYATHEARQAGLQPDDRRDWQLGPAAFAALASAPAQGVTVYDAIAAACYSVIKTDRRPISPGTSLFEDGSIVLPNGEVFGETDVDHSSGTPTVPSEFADASDV